MKSEDTTNGEHHHYWQDGLIPVSPQARRFGYTMEVYVTPTVWKDFCVWKGPSKLGSNVDKRIFEMLQSCFEGMGKALSTGDDRVFFTFHHWFWPNDAKPNKKKRKKAKLGARLLLHPETEEPWLLLFDLARDSDNDLKIGDKPDDSITEHPTDDGQAGKVGLEGRTGLD